jgi:tetratricopeptide (TPR) repeat protein
MGLLFILLIYSNSVSVPFYFDDLEVVNESIKIDHLSVKNIQQAIKATHIPNRPVADLSLILDYHFSKEGSSLLFHLVNIGIHLFVFLFIFLFLRLLLSLPALSPKLRAKALPIALAASLLWAVHPLQTQGVTYIVQRMTSLCTLFYFMSLYFYLKARLQKRGWLYILSVLAFGLALGSKEIAATLPFMIILIEGFFFQPNKKKFVAFVLISVLVVTIASFYFVGGMLPGTISSLKNNKYANRPFLISERLLTEPRVFLHYISLTIFPFYARYVLDYDYPVSHSLFDPPSTLFGLLFLITTLIAAFFLAKKNKILSFAILAFWLGHVIEGTIFNLEIAFEHRMYLPSIFLILIVVLLAFELIGKLKMSRKAVMTVTIAVIVYLGTNTYLRNEMWKDPIRFFQHNIEKTPNNFRPYHNLGVTYGMRKEFESALSYFQKALAVYKNAPIVYSGIGQSYFSMKDYQAAIPNFLQAMAMGLTDPLIYTNLSVSYLRMKMFEEAIKTAQEGFTKYPEDTKLMVTIGSIFYFGVQELGNKGQELMKAHGLNEAQAFSLLDSAYARGNRDVDVFVNLPPAYGNAARRETTVEKQSSWLNRAISVALEGLDRYPGDADIRNNLIGVYLLGGRWQKTLTLPDLTKEDYMKVVLFLFNTSQFKSAEEVLKTAVAKWGTDQVVDFNLAICAYYLGREDDAVASFKKFMAATSSSSVKFQADHFIKEWEKKRVRK